MERRGVLLKPLAIWAALLALGAVSLGYALLPGAPAKPLAALAIFLGQAALVLTAFMKLARAGALVRMTALIALVWLGFLFLLAITEILTR